MAWKLAIKALQKGVGSMDYTDCLLMEQDEMPLTMKMPVPDLQTYHSQVDNLHLYRSISCLPNKMFFCFR